MKFSLVFIAISAALFSSVSAGLISLKNTNVDVHHVASNIANDADLRNVAKNANVDAVSHVLSGGGDRHDD